MTFSIGWFSTGRDRAARDLLATAHRNMANGLIPARIEYVFCNRDHGEHAESDFFLAFVREMGIEPITLSSKSFLPEERKRSMDNWRSLYHQAVLERIQAFRNQCIMLAGYMLIVSPEMCRRHTIINLHPAAPGGPAGTWQEVIWQLIARRAPETGIMMHVVTEVLDEGPPITYCTFPIRGAEFDPLWDELDGRLKSRTPAQLAAEEGESNRLFQRIRAEGVKRELPLIVMTLKTLAENTVDITRENPQPPRCLNTEIEAYLKKDRTPNSPSP